MAAVAAALSDRLAAVSDDVQRVIEREIPALAEDQRIMVVHAASVAENIITVVHALRYGLDVSVIEPPTSASEYARRLAQRSVDAAVLVRAYRVGQARFVRLFMEELHAQTGADEIDGATTMRAIEQVSGYIDQIVGRLLPVYEQERNGWLQNRNAVVANRVRSVLSGAPTDVDRFEQALGYRLRQRNRASSYGWTGPSPNSSRCRSSGSWPTSRRAPSARWTDRSSSRATGRRAGRGSARPSGRSR